MNKQRNILEGVKITIDNNIMQYQDSIIQLSNISRVDIAPIPQEKYPAWAIIGLLIGLLTFEVSAFIAFVILFACAAYLYVIFQKNQDLGKYLILELNSGKSIIFSSKDEQFLRKALDVLVECFNGRNQYGFINFGNYQIGDNNTINS